MKRLFSMICIFTTLTSPILPAKAQSLGTEDNIVWGGDSVALCSRVVQVGVQIFLPGIPRIIVFKSGTLEVNKDNIVWGG